MEHCSDPKHPTQNKDKACSVFSPFVLGKKEGTDISGDADISAEENKRGGECANGNQEPY